MSEVYLLKQFLSWSDPELCIVLGVYSTWRSAARMAKFRGGKDWDLELRIDEYALDAAPDELADLPPVDEDDDD